jgi:hypothetical protein
VASAISETKQLLVEGRDDERFFVALLREMRIKNVQVLPYHGKEKLKDFVKSFAIAPGFRSVVSVGIVRDADKRSDSAFQSVQSAIKSVGWAVPDAPAEAVGDSPKVITFILPGQDRKGELEDLLLDAVANDPAIPCVDAFLECVKEEVGSFPRKLSKAKTQAFLASRKESGLLLGQAADAGHWNFRSRVYSPIKKFLRAL